MPRSQRSPRPRSRGNRSPRQRSRGNRSPRQRSGSRRRLPRGHYGLSATDVAEVKESTLGVVLLILLGEMLLFKNDTKPKGKVFKRYTQNDKDKLSQTVNEQLKTLVHIDFDPSELVKRYINKNEGYIRTQMQEAWLGLPEDLKQIGKLYGLSKVETPGQDDTEGF